MGKIERFFSKFSLQNYPKKVILLGGDEHAQGVFYIKSGYVRQFILSSQGEEQTVVILGPGSIFPLIGTITGKERKYRYVETMSFVTVYSCPKKAFTTFLTSNPDVVAALLKSTLERVDDLVQHMAYFSFSAKAQEKVYAFLLLLSQRFGGKTASHLLPFVLTHKDISVCVGISRETVSIALKKLLDEGVVIQKDHHLGVNFHKKRKKQFAKLHDILS